MAAEEVVQDTFVSVWKHAPSYTKHLGVVRTWLIALTRHRAIDHLRRVQCRSSTQELPWEAAKWEAAAILPDVWENAWRVEQRGQIREALVLIEGADFAIFANVGYNYGNLQKC